MKTLSSKMWLVALICLILGCLMIPVAAQDNPPAATAVQQETVVQQPAIQQPVVQQPVVQQPVIQPVLIQPANQTTETETPLVSLDLYDIFIGLLVIVGLVWMVWRAAKASGGDPVKFDRDVSAGLDAQSQDREKMARLEGMYQQSEIGRKQLVDLFSGVFGTVGPYTPFKMDDALARFFQDIQNPGAAPLATAAAAPGMPAGVEVNVNGVPIGAAAPVPSVPGYYPIGTPVPTTPLPPETDPVDVTTRGAGSWRFIQDATSVPQQPLPTQTETAAG